MSGKINMFFFLVLKADFNCTLMSGKIKFILPNIYFTNFYSTYPAPPPAPLAPPVLNWNRPPCHTSALRWLSIKNAATGVPHTVPLALALPHCAILWHTTMPHTVHTAPHWAYLAVVVSPQASKQVQPSPPPPLLPSPPSPPSPHSSSPSSKSPLW